MIALYFRRHKVQMPVFESTKLIARKVQRAREEQEFNVRPYWRGGSSPGERASSPPPFLCFAWEMSTVCLEHHRSTWMVGRLYRARLYVRAVLRRLSIPMRYNPLRRYCHICVPCALRQPNPNLLWEIRLSHACKREEQEFNVSMRNEGLERGIIFVIHGVECFMVWRESFRMEDSERDTSP